MTPAFAEARPVARIELAVAAPLEVADARRGEIAAHFADLTAANPKLWNGSFFLFEDVRVEGDAFRATARPTDYATFLHWRGRGFPGEGHTHVFPVPAVTTADDRLLVGVMGRSTSNAGLAYPPSGSFDHLDLADGRLDPVANMVRELGEEVGMDAARLIPQPGFTVLDSGPGRLALIKRWRARETAADLAAAIAAHIGGEPDPELGGFDFVPFSHRFDAAKTVPYVNALLALLEASGRPT